MRGGVCKYIPAWTVFSNVPIPLTTFLANVIAYQSNVSNLLLPVHLVLDAWHNYASTYQNNIDGHLRGVGPVDSREGGEVARAREKEGVQWIQGTMWDLVM